MIPEKRIRRQSLSRSETLWFSSALGGGHCDRYVCRGGGVCRILYYSYVPAPTVCLGSTKFLCLWQHFYPKKWRGRTIRLSSVINNAAMYDAICPPLFFNFFKVKLLPQSAKRCVCMVKTRQKSWGFLLTPSICSLAPENLFTQCSASQSPG